jgi:hypothetical protein
MGTTATTSFETVFGTNYLTTAAATTTAAGATVAAVVGTPVAERLQPNAKYAIYKASRKHHIKRIDTTQSYTALHFFNQHQTATQHRRVRRYHGYSTYYK